MNEDEYATSGVSTDKCVSFLLNLETMTLLKIELSIKFTKFFKLSKSNDQNESYRRMNETRFLIANSACKSRVFVTVFTRVRARVCVYIAQGHRLKNLRGLR